MAGAQRKSSSLVDYLGLGGQTSDVVPTWPDRPEGQLVWLHVARSERLPAVVQLATRLLSQRSRVSILITAARGIVGPRRLKQDIIWVDAPDDAAAVAQRFLAHFQPDICVWTSGDLVPSLIEATAEALVPLVLVDAVEDGFPTPRPLGRTGRLRKLLGYFSAIMASDTTAAQKLARLNVSSEVITIAGPLQEGSAALPVNLDDLEEVRSAIGPRPIWLAAMVQPEEIDTVLRAHKKASRFAPRLVLVLVPDKPEMSAEIEASLQAEDFRYIQWADGGFPDEMTEVVLADTTGEMGLWYRLASVSFLASSLVPGKGGCDPFEPAALGSAILYGPNCGRHLHAYSRLVEVGAVRMVRDVDSLTAALRQLLAPDRAAAMSLAAWELVSEGAEVADKVTDLVHDILDLAGAG